MSEPEWLDRGTAPILSTVCNASSRGERSAWSRRWAVYGAYTLQITKKTARKMEGQKIIEAVVVEGGPVVGDSNIFALFVLFGDVACTGLPPRRAATLEPPAETISYSVSRVETPLWLK